MDAVVEVTGLNGQSWLDRAGNYASGTYYTTLSGSTQWSHASGVMIDDVAGRKRTVAKGEIGRAHV